MQQMRMTGNGNLQNRRSCSCSSALVSGGDRGRGWERAGLRNWQTIQRLEPLDAVHAGIASTRLLPSRPWRASCDYETRQSDAIGLRGRASTIPLEVDGKPQFEVLNVLRRCSCFDESRSVFGKIVQENGARKYSGVQKVIIDISRVPPDVNICCVDGWDVVMLVSEKLKTVMESTGCVGAMFLPILPDGNIMSIDKLLAERKKSQRTKC